MYHHKQQRHRRTNLITMFQLIAHGIDFDTNQPKTIEIKAASPMVFARKASAAVLVRNFIVENWTVFKFRPTPDEYGVLDCVSGNKGLNAGAYLSEYIDEVNPMV